MKEFSQNDYNLAVQNDLKKLRDDIRGLRISNCLLLALVMIGFLIITGFIKLI